MRTYAPMLPFCLFCTVTLIAGPGFCEAGNVREDEPMLGDMTLHVIPQSHIDLAWWWRYDPETLDVVVKHTLETAFGNMEAFPDYTFTYLQVPAIAPLEERYPDLFYKLRYYTHHGRAIGERLPNPSARDTDGRLAIGSGTYCEFDGCLPCGESLVRQCLHGKRYFLREFGLDVKTAWFQDAWTHPWTLPQILKKSGMDSYMFSRPRGEGDQMFWWEGPDGSRVFAYKPLQVDGESLAPEAKIEDRMRETRERYGVHHDITLIGVGNHGGGAIRADVERMRRAMARRDEAKPGAEMPARIEFSTPARFVSCVMNEADALPVVRYELPATIRGAYTSVGEIKKGNRSSENLLLTLEKFSAIADRLGARPYPRQALDDAWKKLMLNQFHDTISGTDIPPSIADALRRFDEIRVSGQSELDACLNAIGGRIDTSGKGVPVVAFNPLAWERTDIVEAEASLQEAPEFLEVVDTEGRSVPAQITQVVRGSDTWRARFVFVAEAIPSLGYRVYHAKPSGKAPEPESGVRCDEATLESDCFSVRLDAATGCVASLIDKESGREVLDGAGRGNLIQVIEDFGDSEGFLRSADGAAERNTWAGRCWDVTDAPRIRVVEQGPVRAAIEIKRQFGLARFTQRISLTRGVRRVDFELKVDWEGENRMVKVAFPLAVSAPEATYEIPYGSIARPSTGEECAAQQWVDISNGDHGVSLLNDSRYGHDCSPNVIRMSVLRSPTGPVRATETEGVHTVRYAIFPHAADWRAAGTVLRGFEFNNPMIARAAERHAGDLPGAFSFVQAAAGNVVPVALKMAEDSEDLILRAYESTGAAGALHVTLAGPMAADAVHRTDLLENSTEEIEPAGVSFDTAIGPFSIETFKLIRD